MKLCTEVKPKITPEAAEAALEETLDNKPEITAPFLGNYPDLVRESGVIITGKKWEPGRVLTVKFMAGVDPRVAIRIRETAEMWLEFVNIDFNWATSLSQPAEIRIAADPDGGSWSYLGTDAKLIRASDPTMNFGWLTPSVDDTEYHRVVLHEFGHMLGMPHEHQHPQNGIPWDVEAVYAYYGGSPNYWSRADVDNNLFGRYSETITKFTEFDRSSIMLYPIPNELTIGDYQVGWNTELSDGDKKFARWQYPKPREPEPEETDPLADLRRIAITRYAKGNGYNDKVVITKNDVEVALSTPISEAREARADG